MRTNKRTTLTGTFLAIVAILCASLFMGGCTENARTKAFGGNMTVNLPACQKLVVPTWKDTSLWYATRPFRPTEFPETTTFKEQSNFGVLEGTITFVESCPK